MLLIPITGEREAKNIASLPRFLQKQLQLGFQMSGELSASDIPETISSCLNRQREWVDAYECFMREAGHEEEMPEPTTVAELALAEAKFAADFWHREFASAASHLQKTLDDAGNFSVSTACWHKLWLGYALDCAGDAETANLLYQQAHTGLRNIPPLRPEASSSNLSPQALTVARHFQLVGGRVRVPKTLDRDLVHLNGAGSPKQAEESLRSFGEYLGFQATRPDKEHGTGPDVLWICPDKTALCFDAKTDKESGSVYRKDELGQLADHVQWVRDNAQVDKIIPVFVGPEVTASESANPQPGVKVASLAKFHAIAETLKSVYRDIASNSLPLTVGPTAEQHLEKRRLLWPQLEAGLNLIELRDLKTSGDL